MVWLIEKKIFYHVIDLGFETITIPIRVKFEFEVKEGAFVSDSMVFHTLYNKEILEKRYPQLKTKGLNRSIDQVVKKRIRNYLMDSGLISEDNQKDPIN